MPVYTGRYAYETLVIVVFLYGYKCWRLREKDERQILALELEVG